MAVPVRTERLPQTTWLKGEFDNHRFTRKEIVLEAGNNLVNGAVLGRRRVVTTAPTVTAGTNTGNGTLTMDGTTPILDTGTAGTYRAICVTAATNGGRFDILNPAGVMIGETVVGTVFSREIKFTINDGSTDFAVGDSFSIAVASGTSKYVPIAAPGAADGSDEFAGILLWDVDATAADTKTVAVTNGPAAVTKAGLVWPSGTAFDTELERAPVYEMMEKALIKLYVTA